MWWFIFLVTILAALVEGPIWLLAAGAAWFLAILPFLFDGSE